MISSGLRFILSFAFLILAVCAPVIAQKTARLPKAEKVINDYVKTIGGKKRVAAIKSTVYEWKYTRGGETPVYGRARTQVQNPSLWRFDLQTAPSPNFNVNFDGAATTATNGSAVWRRAADGKLQTVADSDSKILRLNGVLSASKLLDLKKKRVAAIVTGIEKVNGEDAYKIELAARTGAKIRYFFGTQSKLLIKIENPALPNPVCLQDYRATPDGLLEAHKLIENCDEKAGVYELEKVSVNTNLNVSTFDPPRTIENFDIVSLLKEVQKNEVEMQDRISDYTFKRKETERVFDGKGQIKKTNENVAEVFPTRGGNRSVTKLISENGVALSPERAKKEEARTVKELVEAEEDYEKEIAKREKQRQENEQRKAEGKSPKGDESNLERGAILTFLRTSEIYSPRVEFFRDRETIVVNFRPNPSFKPDNLSEQIFSKLAGTAWIDVQEKQIIRAEARTMEKVKFGGGLLANFAEGATLVFERTKFGEVWLPKFFQANAAAKFLIFSGFDAAVDVEYSDYQKFSTEAKDYKLGSPDGAKKP